MDELDPGQRLELDQLREEYQKRHGVAIEFIKKEVGTGAEFRNSVARAVVSDKGAWFECVDLPMEFSGAAGADVKPRFISDRDALTLVQSLYDISSKVTMEDTRHFTLVVLYTRAGVVDPRFAYLYNFQPGQDNPRQRPQSVGAFQEDRLPLFFRSRMDTNISGLPVGFQRGVVFCLTGIGERNLLVEIPYEGPDIRNLGDVPIRPVVQ